MQGNFFDVFFYLVLCPLGILVVCSVLLIVPASAIFLKGIVDQSVFYIYESAMDVFITCFSELIWLSTLPLMVYMFAYQTDQRLHKGS